MFLFFISLQIKRSYKLQVIHKEQDYELDLVLSHIHKQDNRTRICEGFGVTVTKGDFNTLMPQTDVNDNVSDYNNFIPFTF